MSAQPTPPTTAASPKLDMKSRQLAPVGVVNLAPFRPGARTVSTGPIANADIPLCRPLGYQCKAVTLATPDSNYASGANTDSVYIDIEDVAINGTPGLNGPPELPPGTYVTIEECDPGWIHISSPTANQRVFVTYGGPTGGKTGV